MKREAARTTRIPTMDKNKKQGKKNKPTQTTTINECELLRHVETSRIPDTKEIIQHHCRCVFLNRQ
jgi:hypothetical protein